MIRAIFSSTFFPLRARRDLIQLLPTPSPKHSTAASVYSLAVRYLAQNPVSPRVSLMQPERQISKPIANPRVHATCATRCSIDWTPQLLTRYLKSGIRTMTSWTGFRCSSYLTISGGPRSMPFEKCFFNNKSNKFCILRHIPPPKGHC